MDEAKMTEARFYTSKHIISGKVNLIPGARLTDFMREAKEYIVVADVTVSMHDGTKLFDAEFIDVLRREIEIAVPQEAIRSEI